MNPFLNNWKKIYSFGYGDGPSSYIRAKILTGLLKKYKINNYADIGCGKGLLLTLADGGTGYDIVSQNQNIKILNIEKESGGAYQAVVANMLLDILKDDKAASKNISQMAKEYIFIITQWKGARKSKFDSLYVYQKYDVSDIQNLFSDFEIKESFIWGFPIYSMYYRLLELLHSENSNGKRVTSKLNFLNPFICMFFALDNLFKTKGRLLVAVLKRKCQFNVC